MKKVIVYIFLFALCILSTQLKVESQEATMDYELVVNQFMPGDSLLKEIHLDELNAKSMSLTINSSLSNGDQSLFESLEIQLRTNHNEIIYTGKLSDFDEIKHNFKTLPNKLILVIKFPLESTSELAGKQIEFSTSFTVEEESITDIEPESEVAPIKKIIICTVSSIVVGVGVILGIIKLIAYIKKIKSYK